ncbi:MAG TPA: hypothetical protein VL985_12360 [Stellaceae bacterium]|nr:hypothetical protein [Stellaceae bacterium]
MTQEMSADAADRRTFQTSRGICRGPGQAGDKQWHRKDHRAFHVAFSISGLVVLSETSVARKRFGVGKSLTTGQLGRAELRRAIMFTTSFLSAEADE